MTLILGVPTAQASANAAVAKVDVTTAGSLKIYSGAQPATPATAATGTLLATFTLHYPSFATADSTGTCALIVSPAISTTGAATGTAGYGRLEDSTGAVVLDGDVGTSAAVFNLTSLSVTSGQTIDLISGSYQQPVS